MSTLAEIEAAVDRLPPEQQKDLYAFPGARLQVRPMQCQPPGNFATWLQTARGVGVGGMTTDEIMAMTRGEA